MAGLNHAFASDSRAAEELDHSITGPVFKPGYHPELDGLRGISILLVLAHHLGLHWNWSGGFLGVDIFFVLSGCLITSLLLQEWNRRGQLSLKRFYVRRILRLMPALYTLMLLLGLYALIFLDRQQALNIFQSILVASLYASNWILAFNYGYQLGPLAITWSLAIEEQFYLLWPLTLALALRLKMRRSLIVSGLALVVVMIALHRAMLWHEGAPVRRLYYATDTRADALLTGCLAGLAVSSNFWPKIKRLGFYMKALAIIAALVAVYQISTSSPTDARLFLGGFNLFSLAIAQLIVVMLLWPSQIALAVLSFAPLVWVGRISYGLYLWHWAVLSLVYPRHGEPVSSSRMAAMVALSFTAAALSFYFIEKPFLRLKQRRFGSV